MRQIILLGLGVILAGWLWLGGAPSVSACNNWCEPALCMKVSSADGSCLEWAHVCCDSCDVGVCYQDCPAGQYACGSNRCCDIGGGTTCECEVREQTITKIQKEEAFYPISYMTSITGLSDMQ